MTKVNIVSGFLGAGKTTFIKRLLKACEGQKTVLLENEFGEIAVDSQIVEMDGFDVVELASGCICCSLKIDFENAIVEIAERIKPDRIVIEPTGIGMLSELKGIMEKESISKLCSLQSSTTIVDAVDLDDSLEVFGDFFTDQIANADTVVLSKIQCTQIGTAQKCIEHIKEINPTAFIVGEPWDEIDDFEILHIAQGGFAKPPATPFKMHKGECSGNQCSCGSNHHDHNHDHGHHCHSDSGCACGTHEHSEDLTMGIKSLTVRPKAAISEQELLGRLKLLSSGSCGKVIRAKGFVASESGMMEFSYINGRYSISESNANEAGLCVIGRDMDEDGIFGMFNGF